jgi:DNA-binding transcriptional LysR family regulator
MSNQLELRHFQYFLAVAKERHFRRAAEQLYISQPGLSRQIKQMEEVIGVQLLDRHNRKVELTPSGQYLADELPGLLLQMEKIIENTQMIHQGLKGHLHLGYIGSAMQNVILNFLLSLKKEYGSLQFHLEEMDNQHQVDALLHQKIDLGFVRLDRVPHNLEMRPVFQDTFSLVLPQSHPLTETNFTSLEQLKDEPFILFEEKYSRSYFQKVMQLFDESSFQPITAHYTVQANTIYRLVENHFGVSIVPTTLQHGYDMNIKFIELNQTALRTTLQVVWNKKNINPVMQHVLDHLPAQL